MLDDGAKAAGDTLRVEDVAQLVARATGAEPASSEPSPARGAPVAGA